MDGIGSITNVLKQGSAASSSKSSLSTIISNLETLLDHTAQVNKQLQSKVSMLLGEASELNHTRINDGKTAVHLSSNDFGGQVGNAITLTNSINVALCEIDASIDRLTVL